MTSIEQDKELRALLGEMPYFVIDWLELGDDLRHEWKKGGKASDFGGHRVFIRKYEKKLAKLITADRKRVALEARLNEVQNAYEYWINGTRFISSYFRDRIAQLSNTKESKDE